MTTKLLIDRELLEQVASEFEHDNDRYMLGRELRKVLDTPRQPEGDGLEVIGFAWLDTAHFRRKIPAYCIESHWHPLCRLSDHQRAIAELREECEHLKDCQENAMLHMTGLVSERDTLRQQLSERDATIARLEAGIPRIQEQSHQMRQQRDRLAGLLADVKADYTHAIHWEDMHATMKRIDAALAEVKPCPESPAPTT